MKSKFPNQSVLSIITGEESIEAAECQIYFIYVKPVPDFFEGDKFYWLDRKAPVLWGELGVRHWLAFGSDDAVVSAYEKLLTDGFIDVEKKRLLLAKVSIGLESCWDANMADDMKAEVLKVVDPGVVPPAFCQKDSLAALSGYRPDNENIKSVKPAGFFSLDFLYDRLVENLIGYRERRIPHMSFRGIRTTSIEGEGSTQLIGFYQKDFKTNEKLQVVAKTKELSDIGTALIDPSAGLFKMELSQPSSEGVIQVAGEGGVEYSESYALLQQINGTIDMVANTFRDTWGRQFPLRRKERIRLEKLKSSSWYRPFFSDKKVADMQLSDKVKELFDFLGPAVLIADPYFLGPIRKDKSSGNIVLSHCQLAFFAALLRSVVEGGLRQLYVLGYEKRANQLKRSDDTTDVSRSEDWFKDYERLILYYFDNNKLQSYRKDFRMQFLNSDRDMHNRCWLEMTEDSGILRLERCVVVTNSIGNISEVDILPVEEEGHLRDLTDRYLSYFRNAKLRLQI